MTQGEPTPLLAAGHVPASYAPGRPCSGPVPALVPAAAQSKLSHHLARVQAIQAELLLSHSVVTCRSLGSNTAE